MSNEMKDTNPKDAIGVAKWRQFAVVPLQVIWEVGVGMLEGAMKYGRHNYRASGVRASVYVDASLGHIQAWFEGQDLDPDTGLSHITKAICSLVVLRDAEMNKFLEDDRPPKVDVEGHSKRLQGIVDDMFEKHKDKSPHHYTHVVDGAPYLGDPWNASDKDFEDQTILSQAAAPLMRTCDLQVGRTYQMVGLSTGEPTNTSMQRRITAKTLQGEVYCKAIDWTMDKEPFEVRTDGMWIDTTVGKPIYTALDVPGVGHPEELPFVELTQVDGSTTISKWGVVSDGQEGFLIGEGPYRALPMSNIIGWRPA